jgi:hypothetical protein
MSLCPCCGRKLNIEIKRMQACPLCHQNIFVRHDKLVTEDEAFTIDWLAKLESLEVNRKYFDSARENLSARLGKKANSHDTVWNILNILIGKYANGDQNLALVYELMGEFLADEDKDPTRLLVQYVNARKKYEFDWEKQSLENSIALAAEGLNWFDKDFNIKEAKTKLANMKFEPIDEQSLDKTKQLPISGVFLKYVRRLSNAGKIVEAEQLLNKASPSDAVTEEFRRLAIAKEKSVKK